MELNPGDFESIPFSDDFEAEITLSDELPESYLSKLPATEARYIKPLRLPEVPERFLKYDNAVELAKSVVIEKGCRIFAVVNGTFYFGDFIEALMTEHNLIAKKMTISTLSMNENNVDSLANLCNGEFVDELNLIVSDYFFSHERHNLIPYLYEELDKEDRFQLAVASTHCKLCIIETHCGKFIVIHGSASIRSSWNIEQFMIEENEQLYRFNDEIQGFILEKYKTINKSIRNNTLWNLIKDK